jgi:membrane fusion protein, multidrug efflux system
MPRTTVERSLIRGIITSLFIFLMTACLGACDRGDRNAASSSDSTAVAAVDSSTMATADSSDSVKKQKSSWLDRFRQDDEEKDEEQEVVPVELARVEIRDVPSFLSATASLEPERQVEILTKASGQIGRLFAEEGDLVRRGQVLAILDGDAERVALDEVNIRSRNLEREFRRSETLYKNQGISDREFQEISFRYEEAEAQRRAAQLRLDNCEIKAPFTGYLAERMVDQGQHTLIGSKLFTLVDADPLLARIFLPEKEAIHIAPGQHLLITPDTAPDLELTGEVLRIAPIVDVRTGTVKVTCRIAGQADLRPGSFVRVKVQTGLHAGVKVIPKLALVPEGGETYVFKAVADSVIKVGIKTGYTNGEYVEITEGLELGEEVVTVGTGSLKSGTRIEPLEYEDPITDDELVDSSSRSED